MKKYSSNVSISNLICPCCSNLFPIPRIKGKYREKGHIKTIWCPFCKEEKNMKEEREMDVSRNYFRYLIEY